MTALDVLVLYNEPHLDDAHPDAAAEAGVLEAVAGVSSALAARGHHVRRLGVGADLDGFMDSLRQALPTDVIFNLCEGLAGVSHGESQITGLLELLPVAVTGSSAECLALVRNKPRTQWLLAGAGLPTPAFIWLQPNEPIDRGACQALLTLGPAIVKPAHEDASLGITAESVVTNLDQLECQVDLVRGRYGSVLIEQFIAGREFNAGAIALPEPTALPLAEIEFAPGRSPWNVLTYESKWNSGSAADLATPPRCPARVDADLAARIRTTALAAFNATGCRDYARVDLRVDHEGRVYILDVNGNPDISPSAGLARALDVHGLSYADFVDGVVQHAWQTRGGGQSRRCGSEAAGRAPVTENANPAAACTIRALRADDLPALLEILRACKVFRPEEVAVGHEVLREALSKPTADDYQVLVAEVEGQIAGWSCHGRVPMTDATYDLYWIAVDPARQHGGIGSQLVARVEVELRSRGARWLIAETSASEAYGPTRRFYNRSGFAILSQVRDYYRRGDGRVIFGRRLDEVEPV